MNRFSPTIKFSEPKLVSSNCFLCPTVQTPKNIKFTIICDKEKQQILTCEQLKPGNLWHFVLKITETILKIYIFCQLTTCHLLIINRLALIAIKVKFLHIIILNECQRKND